MFVLTHTSTSRVSVSPAFTLEADSLGLGLAFMSSPGGSSIGVFVTSVFELMNPLTRTKATRAAMRATVLILPKGGVGFFMVHIGEVGVSVMECVDRSSEELRQLVGTGYFPVTSINNGNPDETLRPVDVRECLSMSVHRAVGRNACSRQVEM